MFHESIGFPKLIKTHQITKEIPPIVLLIPRLIIKRPRIISTFLSNFQHELLSEFTISVKGGWSGADGGTFQNSAKVLLRS